MNEPVRSLGLFYFSGTGNTELLAENFAAELRQLGASVDLARMETHTLQGEQPDVARYDLLGLGYPVHAFTAPRIVFDFIDLLPAGAGRHIFLFKCPGDHFAAGGSTLPVRRRLAAKGYAVVHESMLVMPANFAVRYPDALAKELYDIARRRISLYAREILAVTRRLQRNTPWERLCTLLGPIEQLGARLSRLHFQTRRSCTGCGLCASRCPAANIRMPRSRPSFGWRCLICLRCVYLCPVRAIGIRGLNFLLFKQGYDIRKVVADESVPATYLTPDTKGYYRRFRKYVEAVDGRCDIRS